VSTSFEWICEIEPPTRPDLMHVRHQIGVLSKVASAYLIPDNHVGRATVSSIAVAHEVDRMGGRAIACLNARDRNALGFRRDLLTGAAYGVDEFLFVYGDNPAAGARTGQLTVRSMIETLRDFSAEHQGDAGRFRAGVTTRLRPLPDWKRAADFLYVQVSFDLDALLAWRETVEFPGRVYAGVMVLPSGSMARKLSADIPEIVVPPAWLDAIERDRSAGTELACDLAEAIAGSGAFDGVHLVPGVRYREAAARLEPRARSSPQR
jgi:5,10-methylenetetrahydrofolate reductase